MYSIPSLPKKDAPHLYKVEPLAGQERIPADSLIEKIKTASGGTVISVAIPADPERTYQFNVKKKGDDTRGGITYMVNAYTGEITGTSKDKNGARIHEYHVQFTQMVIVG